MTSTVPGESQESVGQRAAARHDRSHVRVLFAALAAALMLATLLLAYGLPLSGGRLLKPAVGLMPDVPFWSFLLEHRPVSLESPAVVAALVLAASGLGFLACFLGLFLAWRRRDPWIRGLVIGTSIVCTAATVVAPPNLNSNPYNYMMRARVAAAHGGNPYVTPADEFPGDPFMPFANHAYTDTPGGKLPAWMIVNVTIARLSGDDVVRNLVSLRFFLFLVGIACIALVSATARRLAPDQELAGLVLWAWNPIVIMNVQTRTDTMMVFYLLLGMFLLACGHRRWAVVPLTLSVFVKIFTIPFLVVAALSDVRARRWREISIAILIVLATTVIIWLPFREGLDAGVFLKYANLASETGGVADDTGTHWLRLLVRIGFVVLVAFIGWTRRDLAAHLLSGWVLVSLYFSVFFAKFASSDYLMTLLAITAVVLSGRAVIATAGLSVSFFLFDMWFLAGTSHFRMPDLFPFARLYVFLIPIVAAGLIGLLLLFRRAPGGGPAPRARLPVDRTRTYRT